MTVASATKLDPLGVSTVQYAGKLWSPRTLFLNYSKEKVKIKHFKGL